MTVFKPVTSLLMLVILGSFAAAAAADTGTTAGSEDTSTTTADTTVIQQSDASTAESGSEPTESTDQATDDPGVTTDSDIPPNPEAPAEPVAAPPVNPANQPTAKTEHLSTAVKINIVEVNETFFRLKLDPETNLYQELAVTEAKPGDLIKLVISAENKSDQTLTDVEMVNTIPEGPVTLLKDSFRVDDTAGLFRISRNGETFFPSDAELEPKDIRYVQWVIFSMEPGDVFELSYRIKIDR